MLVYPRSRNRPFHLGPFPLEALQRDDSVIAEESEKPPAQPTTSEREDGLLVAASDRYSDIYGSSWKFTPGGKRMTGDYDRHAYAYVVPDGEKGAGSTMFMVQLNEETIWVKIGTPPSAAGDSEMWRRCSERIS